MTYVLVLEGEVVHDVHLTGSAQLGNLTKFLAGKGALHALQQAQPRVLLVVHLRSNFVRATLF